MFDLGFVSSSEPFKKLVNQGMILGNSAFIFRASKTNTYVSKNLINDNQFERVRVDISLVDENDELDIVPTIVPVTIPFVVAINKLAWSIPTIHEVVFEIYRILSNLYQCSYNILH